MTEKIDYQFESRLWRTGFFVATSTILIASFIYNCRISSTIPNVKKVQDGYVPPSKIEITVDDLDQNGKKETIEKINGVPYLLKYDNSGRAVLQLYEIKPVK